MEAIEALSHYSVERGEVPTVTGSLPTEGDRPESGHKAISIPNHEWGESTVIGSEFDDDILVTSRERRLS